MRLLILGGTAFLGRAIAAAALAGGHRVTCAARGTAPAPAGVEFRQVDREHDSGLEPLRGGSWDAVVDVSRHPGQVRRAVRDVAAGHWVYVSSASAYARFDRLEQGEDAELAAPLAADTLVDPADYGAAKVACEAAVAAGSAGATIVRPALIGGVGDWTGRSGYYPWRFAHPTGADVLVPPDPDFPCALLDVDDLAAWVVGAAQRRLVGTFNVAGPTTSLGELLTVARAVAGSAAVPRPVPAEALQREGVAGWMGPKSLPLWVRDPGWRFVATLDTSAARAAGLRTRPLAETLAGALAYEESRTEPRQAGLSDAEEVELRGRLP